VLMRDLCDDGQPVGPWVFMLQPDLAGSNTNAGFLPNTPDQWITVTYTNPGWSFYYPHAEFMLRIIKPFMGEVTDEGFYVDDINIGEADIVLGSHERPRDAIAVFPDPATDHVTITAGMANALLSVVDMEGREVYRTTTSGRTDLDISQWTPGAYVVSLRTDDRMLRARLIVQ
ncbi:MAG TPA: T9SS type A sorting domain-containing protein, partial [Flavobacteriales bacterium]|nr:T9SS type A sorting domain-containing protein [Flavobacteriales bacterium]